MLKGKHISKISFLLSIIRLFSVQKKKTKHTNIPKTKIKRNYSTKGDNFKQILMSIFPCTVNILYMIKILSKNFTKFC